MRLLNQQYTLTEQELAQKLGIKGKVKSISKKDQDYLIEVEALESSGSAFQKLVGL